MKMWPVAHVQHRECIFKEPRAERPSNKLVLAQKQTYLVGRGLLHRTASEPPARHV